MAIHRAVGKSIMGHVKEFSLTWEHLYLLHEKGDDDDDDELHKIKLSKALNIFHAQAKPEEAFLPLLARFCLRWCMTFWTRHSSSSTLFWVPTLSPKQFCFCFECKFITWAHAIRWYNNEIEFHLSELSIFADFAYSSQPSVYLQSALKCTKFWRLQRGDKLELK